MLRITSLSRRKLGLIDQLKEYHILQLMYHKWRSFNTGCFKFCCLDPGVWFFRKDLGWMILSEWIFEMVGSSSLFRYEFPKLSPTKSQAKTSSNNNKPKEHRIDYHCSKIPMDLAWLNWVELDPRKLAMRVVIPSVSISWSILFSYNSTFGGVSK